MTAERTRRGLARNALLPALVLAFGAALPGCLGSPAPALPADTSLSPDEQVLLTLDCYNPQYKVDEDGHVTNLNLAWRHLPAPALAEIDKLTELHEVDLAHSTVDDAGLAQLKDLQKLHNMGLTGTPITDKGLAHLQKMSSLQWLWLPKETVSKAAVEKLQEARPDMHIYLQ
jgi:hypothetical protein